LLSGSGLCLPTEWNHDADKSFDEKVTSNYENSENYWLSVVVKEEFRFSKVKPGLFVGAVSTRQIWWLIVSLPSIARS
jgi:hypothetical protein